MLALLLYAVVILLVAGVVWYLISIAPFIAEPFKSFAQWVIIAIAVLVIVVYVVLPLIGQIPGP